MISPDWEDIVICLGKLEDFLQDYLAKGCSDSQEEYSIYEVMAGGKRLRPALVFLCASLGGSALEKVIPLAAAVELIHASSLVHDDIIDSSPLRRGKPTVAALYGEDYAVHTGNFLFAKALRIITTYNNRDFYRILAQTGMMMSLAELEQLNRAFFFDGSIRDYLCRIKKKTALLFAVSCQLGAMEGGAENDICQALGRFGHNFGMAYQIKDDVLDFDTSNCLGKPPGNDLKQGFITLPMLYLLNRGGEDARQKLKNIIQRRNLRQKDLQEATGLLSKYGALQWADNLAVQYLQRAFRQLEPEAKDSFRNICKLSKFSEVRQFSPSFDSEAGLFLA